MVELRITLSLLLQLSGNEVKAMLLCLPPGLTMSSQECEGLTEYLIVGEEALVAAWLHEESMSTVRENFKSRTLPAETQKETLDRICCSHN